MPRSDIEHIWYNTTQIRINYLKPPCEVSQSRLNSYASGSDIVLKAVKGTTVATRDLGETFAMANTAFKTSIRNFCGNMLWRYVDEGQQQPFTVVDLENLQVTMSPLISHDAGEYSNAYIEFYDDFEPLSMKVYIVSTITACDLTSATFQSKKLIETYNIGKPEFDIDLPGFKLPPGCDEEIQFESSTLVAVTVPAGFGMD